MKENKNIGKYLLVILSFIIILSIGVSYAYWVGHGIQGEGKNMNLKLSLHGADIIFIDNTEIADTEAMPGWSTTKRFTVENTSNVDFVFDVYIKDFINTLVTDKYFKFKITSTNGYNMEDYEVLLKNETSSDYDLITAIGIPAKTKQEYTIEFLYENDPIEDRSEDMGLGFSGKLMVRESKYKTLFSTLTDTNKYTDIKTRDNFDIVLGDATGTTGVIYKENIYKEDGAPVYYFAGNSLDNWVKFGKEGEKHLYWRIIRTNEDRSIRLLYVGTSPDTTSGYINGKTYLYSKDVRTYNNTMYVGWTYGSIGSLASNRNGDSEGIAKDTLDTWYQNNLKTNYEQYIENNAIYCNDRSGEVYSLNGYMPYAAYSRLYKAIVKQPTYKCGENSVGGYIDTSGSWVEKRAGMYDDASDEDKYTVSNAAVGNKRLKNPVGLMTADEVAFAGGKSYADAPNTYYYLNSVGKSVTGSTAWWTISPFSAYSSSEAYMFIVGGDGGLRSDGVRYSYAVRPVLSLKSTALVTSGNGTAENPYLVTDLVK